MGLKNNKTIKLIVLFIVISFTPIQLAQSTVTHVGTLYSYPVTPPTIDGVFSVDEWGNALEHDITMYLATPQQPNFTLSIKSTFDITAGSISFGITIPDASLDNDIVMFVYRSNTTIELYNTSVFGLIEGQDVKGFNSNSNLTIDSISTLNPRYPLADGCVGGTYEGEGRCQYSSGQYTIELTFPLASNDAAGKDFSLAENSRIEFTTIYYENATELYSQIQLVGFDFGYNVLIIGEPEIFGFSAFTLVVSLVSTMIVFTIIKRKRN